MILLNKKSYSAGFSFSVLWIYFAIFFCLIQFLQRTLLIDLWGFPCNWLFVFLLLPLESFNFWHLYYNISWSRSAWAYLVWGPMYFLYLDICFLSAFGNFPAIISSDIFSSPFHPPSPSVGWPASYHLIRLSHCFRFLTWLPIVSIG